MRDLLRTGDLIGDGDRETDIRFLNGRSTLVPLFEASALVAFSESDSTISPSDGDDGREGAILNRRRCHCS